MQSRRRAYRRLCLSLVLLPASVSPPERPATLDVAGTISLTAGPSTGPGRDAAGRVAYVGGSSGTNRSAGPTAFMDGAATVTADTSTLVDGTGPHHGTITMSKGADAMLYAWRGQVTTVVDAERRPTSTMAGSWTALRGSGRYAGASGRGTYTGRFTSSTESVIEWRGAISE